LLFIDISKQSETIKYRYCEINSVVFPFAGTRRTVSYLSLNKRAIVAIPYGNFEYIVAHTFELVC